MEAIITSPDPTTIRLMVDISNALHPPISRPMAEIEAMQDRLAAHIRARVAERAERQQRAAQIAAAAEMLLDRCLCGTPGGEWEIRPGDVLEIEAECPVHTPTDDDYAAFADLDWDAA